MQSKAAEGEQRVISDALLLSETDRKDCSALLPSVDALGRDPTVDLSI